jgi:hypothetical protein
MTFLRDFGEIPAFKMRLMLLPYVQDLLEYRHILHYMNID